MQVSTALLRSLLTTEVSLEERDVTVIGKGSRVRIVPFGLRTALWGSRTRCTLLTSGDGSSAAGTLRRHRAAHRPGRVRPGCVGTRCPRRRRRSRARRAGPATPHRGSHATCRPGCSSARSRMRPSAGSQPYTCWSPSAGSSRHRPLMGHPGCASPRAAAHGVGLAQQAGSRCSANSSVAAIRSSWSVARLR